MVSHCMLSKALQTKNYQSLEFLRAHLAGLQLRRLHSRTNGERENRKKRTTPSSSSICMAKGQLDPLLVHDCTRECATLGASTTVRQDAEDMDGAGRQPRPGHDWRRRAARRPGCGRHGRTTLQPG